LVRISGKAKIVSVFIGESDRFEGKSLYKAIVRLVRDEGLAGVTVTRGIEGFGPNSRVRSSSILRLSSDLPILVQIIDSEEYVEKILPRLCEMVTKGLITVQDTEVVKYAAPEASD